MTNEKAIEILKANIYRSDTRESSTKLWKACDMAIESLEKQVPNKPVNGWYCPICNEKALLGDYYNVNYCNNCGQKLDWSE